MFGLQCLKEENEVLDSCFVWLNGDLSRGSRHRQTVLRGDPVAKEIKKEELVKNFGIEINANRDI
jgi:hypothetical protein